MLPKQVADHLLHEGEVVLSTWGGIRYINFFSPATSLPAAAQMGRGGGRGSLTWWRTPVVDPAQRAGPKIPGEERDRRVRTNVGRASGRERQLLVNRRVSQG